MDLLDGAVVAEVVRKVRDPARIAEMLAGFVRSSAEREAGNRDRLAKLRRDHEAAKAAITRLLELVEQGLMDAEDASLRERLTSLKVRRDELGREIVDLQKRVASGEPQIVSEKIERLARVLRDNLFNGPAEPRQAHTRLILGEAFVKEEEICISGSRAFLARRASQDQIPVAPAILSFVQEWRARRDSNS